METRKLIQSGPSSLAVSLPMWFVKENALEKGMSIDIESLNKNLLFRPRKKSKTEEEPIKYKLQGTEAYILKEELLHCFFNNVEEVEVHKTQIKPIKKLLNKLPGMEISIEGEKILIRNYLDKSQFEAKKEITACILSINYIFNKILTMGEDPEEITSLIKYSMRKLLITERLLNEYIKNPEVRARFQVSYPEAANLKMFAREMTYLFKNQLELVRIMTICQHKNVKLMVQIVKPYFNLDLTSNNLNKTIKSIAKLRMRIDKFTNKLVEVKSGREITMINRIIHTLCSLERLLLIRQTLSL